MKVLSRAALSLLLITSAINGQGGEFALDDNHQFLSEPGNLVVEHALWDYHHYYPKTCDLKFIDLSFNPIFKHCKAIDGNTSINTYGAFIQGQFNFGDLWLRVNTIFGDVKQKHEDGEERSHFGVDDVLLKGGYDLYFNGDDHFGLYVLGGFPTKKHLESKLILNSDKTEGELEVVTPELGTKHFRVGGGINGAWTLFDCDDHHLAFMLDTQYRYAFPTTYTHTIDKVDGKNVVKETSKAEVRFTPGHTVNAWTALHYAYGNCNFEFGSAFTTTFSKKLCFNEEEKKPEEGKADAQPETDNKPKSEVAQPFSLDKIKTPDTIKFGATPYVAISYNAAIFDNPITLGCGIGYDFNSLHHETSTAHKFQGVVGWINASLSF